MFKGLLVSLGVQLGVPASAWDLQLSSLTTLATLQYSSVYRLLARYNMAIDKITANDPRIQHRYAEIDGQRWHYLDAAVPADVQQRGTIVLVHGFPDLSLAWRYQIPVLLRLGLRCVAIDCMGYGETGYSDKLEDYTFKRHADAIAGIAKEIGASRIILGGHDWGGMVVCRTAQWHPTLVTHLFSIATPYMAPQAHYIPTATLVSSGGVPQFGYQLQFGSDDGVLEKVVEDAGSEERGRRVGKFLRGLYGGKVVDVKGKARGIMTPEEGVDLSVLEDGDVTVGMTPLMNEEELTFYTSSFTRLPLRGPCNWYRTRQLNHADDLRLPPTALPTSKEQILQPTLFVQCLDDNILIPKMSRGMDEKIPRLVRGEVKAGHWALWQAPAEVNGILEAWVEGVVFGGEGAGRGSKI